MEEAAISALVITLASSNNVDLLRAVAGARANDDLQGIGLDDSRVAALWTDTAFVLLAQAADKQLLAIEKKAASEEEAAPDDDEENSPLSQETRSAERLMDEDRPQPPLKRSAERSRHRRGQSEQEPGTPTDGSDPVKSPVAQDSATAMKDKIKRMFLVEQEGVLAFSEGKVEKDKFKQDLALPEDQFQAGNDLSVGVEGAYYYQGALIDEDEVVRAYKVYADTTSTDPRASPSVALLVQDSNGVITDFSQGDLTAEQKTEIALKQAQMLLANYRPEHGDIIIRGRDPEMANKVFAALLVLKSAHPALKDIPIKSRVGGCEGPQYVWHTRDSVTRNNYINQHLTAHAVKTESQVIIKQLDKLTTTKQKRFKEMHAILKQPDMTEAEKQEALDKYNLHDGDRLEVTGEVHREDTDDLQTNVKP